MDIEKITQDNMDSSLLDLAEEDKATAKDDGLALRKKPGPKPGTMPKNRQPGYIVRELSSRIDESAQKTKEEILSDLRKEREEKQKMKRMIQREIAKSRRYSRRSANSDDSSDSSNTESDLEQEDAKRRYRNARSFLNTDSKLPQPYTAPPAIHQAPPPKPSRIDKLKQGIFG
jgi:hypothetical protein